MAADESSSGSPVRLKLIALGVGAVAGLGCALVFMLTQGHHAAATVRAVPSVQFAYVEHAPMVGNDETPESVVAFEKTRYDARIAPNSSGTLTSRPIGTPYFNSATDERHWRTLQRPVSALNGKPSRLIFAPGQWGFLPSAGPPLTYSDVMRLGSNPSRVTAVIRSHIGAPPAQLSAALLRAYGFLLADAPLRSSTRKAGVFALKHLPGVANCGAAQTAAGESATLYCTVYGYEQTGVMLSRDNQVLQVQERLVRRTPVFPRVKPGTVFEWDLFVGHS